MLAPSSGGVIEPHTIHMPYLFSGCACWLTAFVTSVPHVINHDARATARLSGQSRALDTEYTLRIFCKHFLLFLLFFFAHFWFVFYYHFLKCFFLSFSYFCFLLSSFLLVFWFFKKHFHFFLLFSFFVFIFLSYSFFFFFFFTFWGEREEQPARKSVEKG